MVSRSEESDEFAKIWDESPELIREFINIRPQYDQLCSEVEYILLKRMDESGIEYSGITSRAKTLKSFSEKILRKHYEHPLKDITDLAGVRIVYLYKSDRPATEKIIESEFEIIERVDKIEEQEADEFGYGALHYLVHLGRKSSGARYDDLKGMICEIQVRTIGQDAWAIIDHHLSYKQESDVPKILRRKINSLSGFFETADEQFDRIRAEREEYRSVVKNKLESKDKSLEQETNLDTFAEYLQYKFPGREVTDEDSRLSRALASAAKYGYKSLSDIDALLHRTEKAREAIANESSTPISVGEVVRAMALEQPSYRKGFGWDADSRARFKRYEHLVEK